MTAPTDTETGSAALVGDEPRRSPRAWSRIGNVVYVVAGSAGAIAIAWLLFAFITGATIIVFKTGSMAPAMPQGTAALALTTAASDIRVGDVITVQRDDANLPVTHRVISIDATEDETSRSVLLQGDANSTPDPFPHVVTTVPRVVLAAPGLGQAIEFAQSPPAILILTVIVAVLCAAAFWPQNPSNRSSPAVEQRTSRGGRHRVRK